MKPESRSNDQLYDLFVVGGGINGCGVAREAAGCGLSVCLAEKNDLASATSSGSTKLIHGGLRYLEQYDFNLVRKALVEREVLWSIAPHIIRPLRFVLPHHSGLRPAWMLRLGLFLYDHLGGRKWLPGTRVVNLQTDECGGPLQDEFVKGFEYSDCAVDDSRLVVLNAMDAAERGARILTRTRVVNARRKEGHWIIKTQSGDGVTRQHRAKVLVNAAGPWVSQFLSDSIGGDGHQNIRLVRGSHIVVPKLYAHDRCYILQNADGRIFFTIPYEEDFTLIGTTDCDYSGDPDNVRISSVEVAYLCNSFNRYFKSNLQSGDVVWSYSAVRPLTESNGKSAQAATRDYHVEVSQSNSEAPLINIFGGKITTYRKLSESVLRKIGRLIPVNVNPWSGGESLPGGDFAVDGIEQEIFALQQDYPFLPARLCRRLVKLYGTRARNLLDRAGSIDDLGECFGSDLFEAEVRYLIENEWVLKAEDVLWRRTKEGLRIDAAGVAALENFLIRYFTAKTYAYSTQQ